MIADAIEQKIIRRLNTSFLIFKEFGLPLKKKTLNNLHIKETTFIFAHKFNYKSITR